MVNILVIHGPNLNMLGKRNTNVYGNKDIEEVNNIIREKADFLNFIVDIFQSNHEGEIIDKIHNSMDSVSAIIINPGAYTHYSIAIRDAIEILDIPVIEAHLSNIHGREEFRNKSVIAPVCTGQVSGFGYISYLMALDALKYILGGSNEA